MPGERGDEGGGGGEGEDDGGRHGKGEVRSVFGGRLLIHVTRRRGQRYGPRQVSLSLVTYVLFVCAALEDYHVLSVEELVAAERLLSTNTSRTMAAISLGFIVMVTPWTIQEVVAACTGSKVPPFLDFLATWLALSNSFWNPFLYWLLNSQFRLACREMIVDRVLCRRRERSKSQCCGG
ncbi:Uncharacterized protein GBIM_19568, partial [Gryllus bimaculatus]